MQCEAGCSWFSVLLAGSCWLPVVLGWQHQHAQCTPCTNSCANSCGSSSGRAMQTYEAANLAASSCRS